MTRLTVIRSTACGEADIEVERGDNFDHLDAKIQKALKIPHAVSASFDDRGRIQGEERAKPVLSISQMVLVLLSFVRRLRVTSTQDMGRM